MNKRSFLFGFGGLIVGLTIGFFAANAINQSTTSNVQKTLSSKDVPASGQQVQNFVVKDQPTKSAAMPEIAIVLEKAKNEPENLEAQIAAGDLYAKIQNLPKAIEFYLAANKIAPKDYSAIVKIGNAYFDSKQFEKASTWYEKALLIKPDDFGVRTDLGVSFVERENPDLQRALKEFETSLRSNAKHEPTLYNLTLAYFKSGNIAKADETAKQLEEIDPKSELSLKIKQLLEK
jgi:tetratricopeptide (TPR) repeat protein